MTKNTLLIIQSLIILFLLFILFSKNLLPSPWLTNDCLNQRGMEQVASDTDRYQLDRFPIFKLPIGYFDTEQTTIGAGSYSNLSEIPPYQSYPSTEITIPDDFYSTEIQPLPPVKSDEEIYNISPNQDFFGQAIADSIAKYGDLARRFAGEPGEGMSIYAVEQADLTDDGRQEQILSINQMGANVIGEKNVVIKDGQVIFSSALDSFSQLTPAKNNNGFFLKWSDNFKLRDGFVTTKFIYDGERFVPVYEQQTRYVRWQEDEEYLFNQDD